MLQYDSLEQARMRLEGSVITYQGAAYYVRAVNSRGAGPITMSVQKYPIVPLQGEVHGATIVVNQDDPDLNFRKFRLGYVNDTYRKTAVFFTRNTTRQQTQGIHARMLTPNINNELFWGTDFENTLFDRFPTVEEAFERINNQKWTACAISRDFAVGRDVNVPQLRNLQYRGRVVGVALGKSFKHFLINPADAYLAEALTENNFPFVVDGQDV